MERRAGRCNQTNLPLIFVHIDANMLRGWSPVYGTDVLILCEALCSHVRMTGRFISSILMLALPAPMIALIATS
jgi:hypothetical protein